HLVIALDLLEGLLQDLGGILRIAGKEFLERARHPRRRLGKPVAPRIVAGPADDGSKRGLDLGAARAIALVMKVLGALKGMDIAAHRCSLLITGARTGNAPGAWGWRGFHAWVGGAWEGARGG